VIEVVEVSDPVVVTTIVVEVVITDHSIHLDKTDTRAQE
jgi:hypothetical protein